MKASSFSLRRLLALCRKETYQIVRDPSSILIAFVLPVILLFIYGYGINLDTNRIRLGLYSADSGAEAHGFVAALTGSPFLEVHASHSLPAAQDAMKNGAVRGIVVLAADFSAKVRQGRGEAAIQLLTDGSEPNTANLLNGYLQGLWQVWLAQRATDQGLKAPQATALVPRYWFNPSTVSRNFLVPGSISVIMTVIGALLSALVVAREWERGTMEALLSTPVTRAELLLSKILPYYVLGMTAMVMCLVVATVLIGIPLRG